MLTKTTFSTESRPIRVALADDHPIWRKGLMDILTTHPRVIITGCASNGKTLVELVKETLPDVVFTDIQMPEMNGIEATAFIKQSFSYIEVIGISAFAEDWMISGMLSAGASGYLLKGAECSELFVALKKVMNRETYFSHDVANRMVKLIKQTNFNPLKPFDRPRFSEIEMTVLKENCSGLSSKEIAYKLNVPVRTVESAKERLMKKTGCNNSTALAMYAVRNFIVPA